MMRGAVPLLAMAGGLAMPVEAAQTCAATEGWNAQVHDHRDLGAGRVGWTWSWSAEGVADDLHVMECASGQGLVARARAERMTNPLPYDRRDRAEALIASAASAPHFFRMDRLANALTEAHMPVRAYRAEAEPCACAAFYPGVFASGQNDMRDR